MEFVAGTFVLVLAIVAGVVLALRRASTGAAEAARVRQRRAQGLRPGKLTKALLKERERLSDVGSSTPCCARSGQVVAAPAAHHRRSRA